MNKKLIVRGLALVAVVLVLVVLEHRFHLSAIFREARIEERLLAVGPLAAPVFILLMATAVLLPVPTFPLDVLAGKLFGPLLGALYAATGATFGSVFSFLIARWLGRGLVARFSKGHINFCRHCSDKLLTKVVFLARLVPAVSFDVVSYGAGLTKMSVTRFALATFLGMLPLTFAYTSFGRFLSVRAPIAWLGGAVVVALLFLLPRWIERYDLFRMKRLFEH